LGAPNRAVYVILLSEGSNFWTLLGFDSAATYAKGSANPDGGITDVVAHLSLTGNDVVGIFKRETQGRRYLLLQRSSPKTMLLVDITNPKKGCGQRRGPIFGGRVGRQLAVSGIESFVGHKRPCGSKARDYAVQHYSSQCTE